MARAAFSVVPALKGEVELRGVTPWDDLDFRMFIPDPAITSQYLQGKGKAKGSSMP